MPAERPDPAKLLTSDLLGWVAGRVVSATLGHAYHALQDLDNSADEPGPHALLILSAETMPAADDQPAPVTVSCVSRLFHPDDAADLLTLLSEITEVIQDEAERARRAGQLYQQMSPNTRLSVARTALRDRRWRTDQGPFPYQQALREGLLWDPRSPTAGIVGNTTEPLTAASTYLGVAALTLDTDHEPWSVTKRRYTGRDPESGADFTAMQVPAQAWAWLHGGAALHLRRGTEKNSRHYTVHANRRIADDFDSYRRSLCDDDLLRRTPSLSATGARGTTSSRELWQRLHRLHTALAAVLDRNDS